MQRSLGTLHASSAHSNAQFLVHSHPHCQFTHVSPQVPLPPPLVLPFWYVVYSLIFYTTPSHTPYYDIQRLSVTQSRRPSRGTALGCVAGLDPKAERALVGEVRSVIVIVVISRSSGISITHSIHQ